MALRTNFTHDTQLAGTVSNAQTKQRKRCASSQRTARASSRPTPAQPTDAFAYATQRSRAYGRPTVHRTHGTTGARPHRYRERLRANCSQQHARTRCGRCGGTWHCFAAVRCCRHLAHLLTNANADAPPPVCMLRTRALPSLSMARDTPSQPPSSRHAHASGHLTHTTRTLCTRGCAVRGASAAASPLSAAAAAMCGAALAISRSSRLRGSCRSPLGRGCAAAPPGP